mmetsp:Transcript_9303/g.29576  ORF Transcript_9303/g.29576 Transcript_9303/m.29576 type:complete len:265 (+) Transcript_9303:235-1029(+)
MKKRSTSVSTSGVSKRYPNGIHDRKALSVASVASMSRGRCEAPRTNSHSRKISANSAFSESFIVLIFAVVMASLEKSKTSSESSLRMCMLFSHRISEVREAPQMSPMNDGQLCGHSCFRIDTSTLFIWWISVRSAVAVCSSDDSWIILFTMNPLIPARCSSGKIFHRVFIASSSASRPKYRPSGIFDRSMIASACAHVFACSRSFIRILFAALRSGCDGWYAAATTPSRTSTSNGFDSSSSRTPAASILLPTPTATHLRPPPSL